LAARISKHVVFAGPTKCGGGLPWEWSAAEWPRQTVARAAVRRRSIYSPVMRSCAVPHLFIF
jgi:hypothetical protein